MKELPSFRPHLLTHNFSEDRLDVARVVLAMFEGRRCSSTAGGAMQDIIPMAAGRTIQETRPAAHQPRVAVSVETAG
jgi:hypothetical protein